MHIYTQTWGFSLEGRHVAGLEGIGSSPSTCRPHPPDWRWDVGNVGEPPRLERDFKAVLNLQTSQRSGWWFGTFVNFSIYWEKIIPSDQRCSRLAGKPLRSRGNQRLRRVGTGVWCHTIAPGDVKSGTPDEFWDWATGGFVGARWSVPGGDHPTMPVTPERYTLVGLTGGSGLASNIIKPKLILGLRVWDA